MLRAVLVFLAVVVLAPTASARSLLMSGLTDDGLTGSVEINVDSFLAGENSPKLSSSIGVAELILTFRTDHGTFAFSDGSNGNAFMNGGRADQGGTLALFGSETGAIIEPLLIEPPFFYYQQFRFTMPTYAEWLSDASESVLQAITLGVVGSRISISATEWAPLGSRSYALTVQSAMLTPEPNSALLVGLGLAGLAAFRR